MISSKAITTTIKHDSGIINAICVSLAGRPGVLTAAVADGLCMAVAGLLVSGII